MRGAALDSADLTLTSADGTAIAAFEARPNNPAGVGIVIIPDVRGLHRYYEELALRFAEQGVDAVAVDLYARSAGADKRDDAFDYGPHVARVRADTVDDDVAAGVEHLRSGPRGRELRIFTVGFCFGGRVSFLQAAAGLGLSGVIAFYGSPAGSHRSGLPAPVELTERMDCPILGLFAGADQSIPADAREAFDRALTEAGVDHRFVVYERAPHSFFDRRAEQYAEESADAWRRMLDFMGVGRAG